MDYLVAGCPRALRLCTCHADSRNEIEDVAHLNLDFGDGLVASFHVNWLSPLRCDTSSSGEAARAWSITT